MSNDQKTKNLKSLEEIHEEEVFTKTHDFWVRNNEKFRRIKIFEQSGVSGWKLIMVQNAEITVYDEVKTANNLKILDILVFNKDSNRFWKFNFVFIN